MTDDILPDVKAPKVQLVSNAADWWRMWSVRLGILTAALAAGVATIQLLPPDVNALLPLWFRQALACLTVVSGILAPIARIIQQPSLASPRDTGDSA